MKIEEVAALSDDDLGLELMHLFRIIRAGNEVAGERELFRAVAREWKKRTGQECSMPGSD